MPRFFNLPPYNDFINPEEIKTITTLTGKTCIAVAGSGIEEVLITELSLKEVFLLAGKASVELTSENANEFPDTCQQAAYDVLQSSSSGFSSKACHSFLKSFKHK